MGAPQYEQAGADIGGTGTTNTIPRWTGPSTLGDSGLIDNGTAIYTTTRNVGIGTATPVGRADVAGTSVNQSGWGLLSVQSNDAQGADKGGSITFGGVYDASTATHWAQISGRKENGTSGQYGGYLAFATRTNGAGTNTERARIDSAGNFILNTATTGATIQAAGSQQGLKLPATPGNADTQTLDAYRENTFTPTIQGGTTAGVGTYTSQVGTFTIIGRCLFFNVEIAWSAHTGTGVVQLAGLPVAAAQLATFGLDSNYTAAGYLRMSAGNTYAQINTINVPATGNYRVSGCYFIA